jgi:hypothetical protein
MRVDKGEREEKVDGFKLPVISDFCQIRQGSCDMIVGVTYSGFLFEGEIK